MTGAWSRLVGMAGVGCDPSSNRNASRERALDVILLGAIVATVFFLPLSEGLKNLSYSIALACYLGALRRFTRSEWSIPPVGAAFLLFLCVAVLSAATSAFPWKAFSGVWEMFRYTSFFFIVRQGIRRSAQVVAVLWAAVAGIGVAATVVLYQHVTSEVERFSMLSLGGKNGAAEYVVMMLALMIGMFAEHEGSRRARFSLGIIIGASLIVLGVSNARTMWGGFLAVTILLWCRRRSWVLVAAVGIFLAAVAGMVLVRPDVSQRTMALARAETYVDLSERQEIWQGAIRMWRDHPWLGSGPRTFKLNDDLALDVNRLRYGIPERAGQAHNMWLQTAAEMGTIGAIALAIWIAAVADLLLRGRTRFRGWPLGVVWVGAAGSLLTILIAGVTEPGIGYEHSMLISGLLGMMVRADEAAWRSSQPSSAPGPLS
ncbi:O-antigen ligase family protein [Candidatus Methylomirabilis sp.]|uniref:O-antigen ligase family protein n=1 Tax=Candidatus Methylomirabilis sp. TaxID=2032687 RepID=UPI00307602C2